MLLLTSAHEGYGIDLGYLDRREEKEWSEGK